MERSVKVAEREYSRKMADLNKSFEAVGQSFTAMENKMSEVGRTAIRIGECIQSSHILWFPEVFISQASSWNLFMCSDRERKLLMT